MEPAITGIARHHTSFCCVIAVAMFHYGEHADFIVTDHGTQVFPDVGSIQLIGGWITTQDDCGRIRQCKWSTVTRQCLLCAAGAVYNASTSGQALHFVSCLCRDAAMQGIIHIHLSVGSVDSQPVSSDR